MDEATNPYQAPRSDVNLGVPNETDALPDASLGARFANLIIDNIIRVVFAAIGAVGIRFLGAASEAVSTVFMIFSFIGYYIILEALFGWTFGKLITGTRVVDENDEKPSFWRVLGRTLARFIPFEPFSFVFGKAGWHDSLSGTRVVRVRR